jgi:hypothetical protein
VSLLTAPPTLVDAALNETVRVSVKARVVFEALLSAIKLGLADVAVNLAPLNKLTYNRFSIDVTGKLQGTVTVPPTLAADTDKELPTA